MSAVLDGEATPEEETALRAHLTQCPACAALFQDLTTLHDSAEALTVPAPAGFTAAVMEQVHATSQTRAAHRPRWRSTALAAACALVLFGSGLSHFFSGRNEAVLFSLPADAEQSATPVRLLDPPSEVSPASVSLSAAQALDHVISLLYESEGILSYAYSGQGEAISCTVTTQNGTFEVVCTGLSSGGTYYTFSCFWEGQSTEEAELSRYALSLDGETLLRRSDISDGESYLAALEN